MHPQTHVPDAGRPDRLRVLLVEDNADDRLLTLRALQREHASLEVVQPTSPDTLARALEAPYDLVVTDYVLGWTDGLAVTRAVKARHPLCPVVMYTGTGNEEVAVAAMKLGVDDYVLKSPTGTALSLAVRGAIAHAATGGRRDFSSRSSLQAAQYAVLCDPEVADQARHLLIQLNWRVSGAQ